MQEGTHELVVGGGCFWCLEAAYSRLNGVLSVEPGYAGGHLPSPDYESVCSGQTGHAEVVRLIYEPRQVPLDDLLDIFFSLHDPTTINRQGNDIGTQYRSIAFYSSATEGRAIRGAIARHQPHWPMPLVTEVLPAMPFYPAELHHHQYYERHQSQPYCLWVVAPKLEKLAQHFGNMLK